MPVLKRASRQVVQDHSSLQILPVLFPPASSTRTRNLDCCFHGFKKVWYGRGKSQAGIFKCHRALTRQCRKFFFSEAFPLAVVIPDYSTASAKVVPENFCQLFWLFLWGNRALDFLTLIVFSDVNPVLTFIFWFQQSEGLFWFSQTFILFLTYYNINTSSFCFSIMIHAFTIYFRK